MSSRPLGLHLLPLLLALVFFAASLTPSLIPRAWLFQGVLAGLVTGIGYMLGQFLLSLWRVLDLPRLAGRRARIAHAIVAVPVAILLAFCLAKAGAWQNSIRERMEMPPVESAHVVKICLVAILVFLVCFTLGWLVQRLFDWLRFRLYRLMPERSANVAGLLLTALIVLIVTRDGLLDRVLDGLDSSYAAAQNLFDLAPDPPEAGRIPGSAASLVDWGAMGQPGRDFVTGGPDAADIERFSGGEAREPVRVYVGRAETRTPEARARIALDELKRLGGFEREVLVVASPTGTGWMDPGGYDPLEYMHDGDIATVAVQYSYLQSPLALIFETDAGLEQATAIMHAVYDHWTELPQDDRPRLYLHGISLGAWSSMYSFDIFQMIEDPINGALWTGPPFPSNHWNRAVAARNAGTPYVLPVVGDGDLVRFASQYGGLDRTDAGWGPIRVVYLQYASDPIVFYEPQSIWRAPQWMRESPAPDVSAELVFVPVVTQLQLALDMILSKALPGGYGHNYVAVDYIEPWIAVTEPPDWSAAETERLKNWCSLPEKLGCRD